MECCYIDRDARKEGPVASCSEPSAVAGRPAFLHRSPSSAMAHGCPHHRPLIPSSFPSKLTVNFVLPYQSEIANNEVDMFIIPATTRQMDVLFGHVATIVELKTGVLTVHEGNEITKYFVSSGFAFIHTNSVTDIVAVEAVPVDYIDPNLVQEGLADFTQRLNSSNNRLGKV